MFHFLYHISIMFKKNNNYVFNCYSVHVGIDSQSQGWEFAQRFSEQIARFLPKNE